MPQDPQPSVGRVVHYVARGSADGVFPPTCRAATVTEVQSPGTVGAEEHPERVGAAVLNPTGFFFHPLDMGGIEHDERPDGERTPGTWHWPERT